MIPITKPLVGEQEAEAAAAVIRSGWLAQGAAVDRFERALASFVGTRHAVAVSSGTTAMHLCLTTLGLQPTDEVLVPGLGFIATANVVRHAGARPVFVDVDPRSANLDPDRLEAALTPRTRAILPVHQLGLPAAMEPILALARDRGLHVIEDGACALGSLLGGTRVGSLGRACCFSFHPRKVITTGEGGAITTDEDELAGTLRALRSHGMRVTAHERHSARQVLEEQFDLVGYNYRMTDVQAAVGAVQMERLPGIVDRRRQLARRYTEALAGTELTPPAEPQHVQPNFQSYMVLLPPGWTTARRDALMQRLLDRGIATRPGLMAIHLQPIYRTPTPQSLPVTEELARRGLMLPLYPGLDEADQDRVIEALLAGVGG